MTTPPDTPLDVTGNAELRQQVEALQAALAAVWSGGVDAVLIGRPQEEQLYTLDSADRAYRAIVEQMGEGAATLSPDGVVLSANPRLAELVGRPRSQLIGKRVHRLVSELDRASLEELLDVDVGETRRRELRVRRDYELLSTMVACTGLVIDGEVLRCVVVTDLTEERRSRAAIEELDRQRDQRRQRDKVALEVNDMLVQGLAAAQAALELGEIDYARRVIARTGREARAWVGELLGETELRPGRLERSTGAADPEPSS